MQPYQALMSHPANLHHAVLIERATTNAISRDNI